MDEFSYVFVAFSAFEWYKNGKNSHKQVFCWHSILVLFVFIGIPKAEWEAKIYN